MAADATVDSEYLMFFDNWPQDPNPIRQAPTGGFTGEAEHNVATPAHRLGQKARVRNHRQYGSADAALGLDGWVTFIYLQLFNTGGDTPAAKQICVPYSAATGPYVVTNFKTTCVLATGSLLAAVMLSAMTDQYYGWFFCGGVVPEEHVPALGVNFDTDGELAIGPFCAHQLTTPETIGVGIIAGNTEAMIGFSLATGQ